MFLRKKARTAFRVPEPSRIEAAEVERAFARLFSTDDGRRVLAWLNGQTFQRVAAMDAPDATLRYLEGQRFVLAQIIRMIERGRG